MSDINLKIKNVHVYFFAGMLGLGLSIFLIFNPEIGRGSFEHFFICFLSGSFGFPAILLARIVSRFKKLHSFKTILTTVAIVTILISLSIFGGNILLQHDIEQAKTFCNDLVPILEAYYQKNGAYPAKIKQILPDNTKHPVLLKNKTFYSHKENSFVLHFDIPTGVFLNGWAYNSKEKNGTNGTNSLMK